MLRQIVVIFLAEIAIAGIAFSKPPPRRCREVRTFPAAEAHQAVAVDEKHFYAITNHAIGKFDKASGKRVAQWAADEDSPIKHLNSGVVVAGKLYCGHSNWPAAPLKNSIEIWDAETLEHVERRDLPDETGAVTWIDWHRGSWWVAVAFYGAAEDVARTKLVRFDEDWRRRASWRFSRAVIERFVPFSNSGGSWGPDDLLYATGHDRGELYALRIPAAGETLELIDTLPIEITGQGIAWDRSDLGIVWGIRRQGKDIVKSWLSHDAEYDALRQPVVWRRDDRNPILPPGEPDAFDAVRCMNPWIMRRGDAYRLYYAGGDKQGRHRIGFATAPVGDVSEWQRRGTLLETGAAGAFDARWCVLPHVVKFDQRPEAREGEAGPAATNDSIQAATAAWRLYYTGNAGRGRGLSAFPGIGLATSEDGVAWAKHGGNPVLAPSGQDGDPDAIGIAGGSVLRVRASSKATDTSDDKHTSQGRAPDYEWRFYYTGCPTVGDPLTLNQQKTICLAVSRDGVRWEKRGAVMYRDPGRDYENIGVAGPVVHQNEDGSFRMWYSAIGTRWGYYSICYAESDDGIRWRRGAQYGANLQLAPHGAGWESQMVEYPSVIREGDHLRLFYCGNGYGRTGIGTAVSETKE